MLQTRWMVQVGVVKELVGRLTRGAGSEGDGV